MEWRMLSPLVLATMASQALLVVLSPTIVAIGDDLDASVSTVGQARTVTAAVSIVVSLAVIRRGSRVSVGRLLATGAVITLVACAAVAAAYDVPSFLAAHVLVGLGFALLLSGGFAGTAAFPVERRGWATGWVTSANAAAWIVVNPVAAALAEHGSWRVAQAVPAAMAVATLATVRSVVPPPAAQGPDHLWAPLMVPSARRWLSAELAGYAAWTALLTFAGAFVVEEAGASESAAGWVLAAAATAYFVAATRSGPLVDRVPRRTLVVAASVAMAALLPLMLSVGTSTPTVTAVFVVIGVVAGVRTPASAGLGLAQLPGQPAVMSAARTATTQLGYLVGAVLGGLLIAGPGYGPLGTALALVMLLSAGLVLRVDDPEHTEGREKVKVPA